MAQRFVHERLSLGIYHAGGAGTVWLWHFGVKRRRFYLFVASGLATLILLGVAGGPLRDRFSSTWEDEPLSAKSKALGSYEQRKFLMQRAIEGIERYPILEMGTRNFSHSTVWHLFDLVFLVFRSRFRKSAKVTTWALKSNCL